MDVRKSISVQCSFPELSPPPRRTPTPASPVPAKPHTQTKPRYRQAELTMGTGSLRKGQFRYLGKSPLWKYRPHSVTASLNSTTGAGRSTPTQGHRRTVTRHLPVRLALPPYLQAKSLLPPAFY